MEIVVEGASVVVTVVGVPGGVVTSILCRMGVRESRDRLRGGMMYILSLSIWWPLRLGRRYSITVAFAIVLHNSQVFSHAGVEFGLRVMREKNVLYLGITILEQLLAQAYLHAFIRRLSRRYLVTVRRKVGNFFSFKRRNTANELLEDCAVLHQRDVSTS